MKSAELIAELPDLFEELQVSGLEICLNQRLLAQQLLIRLVTRGSLPTDSSQLGRMLGPILCASAADQRQFAEVFQHWQSRLGNRHQARVSTLTSSQVALPTPTRTNSARVILAKLGAALALVLVLAAGIQLVRTVYQLRSAGDAANLDEGPAQLQFEASTRPLPILEIRPSTEMRTRSVVTSGPRQFSAARVGFGLLVTGGMALLVWVAWQSTAAYRRRQYLINRAGTSAGDLYRLSIGAAPTEWFDSTAYSRAAQKLRRHVAQPCRRLHPARTVAETARRGGLFTPVFARQLQSPAYLVLIDSEGPCDQQTQFLDLLVDRLSEEGVPLHRYYFRRDPRICRQS